ncbi:MAG: hypothetical protein QNJ54_04040 [Prochloraceae cyanobacterium]|nr:hypothetical protein [Prochloraceae cyanobacterium]
MFTTWVEEAPSATNNCLKKNMEISEALFIVDNLIFFQTGKHLSTLQVNVFKGAWLGQKYKQIAQNNHCSCEYAKIIGSQLWGLLSQGLKEKVTKKTFRAVVMGRYQNH